MNDKRAGPEQELSSHPATHTHSITSQSQVDVNSGGSVFFCLFKLPPSPDTPTKKALLPPSHSASPSQPKSSASTTPVKTAWGEKGGEAQAKYGGVTKGGVGGRQCRRSSDDGSSSCSSVAVSVSGDEGNVGVGGVRGKRREDRNKTEREEEVEGSILPGRSVSNEAWSADTLVILEGLNGLDEEGGEGKGERPGNGISVNGGGERRREGVAVLKFAGACFLLPYILCECAALDKHGFTCYTQTQQSNAAFTQGIVCVACTACRVTTSHSGRAVGW